MAVVFYILIFIFVGTASGQYSDAENARLPRLFHLDDYKRCLSQKDGLYCLGIFELSPIEPSPVYKQIQEYTSHPFAFNRTLLHRGYCVSTRCPSTERNASLRFERCVDERARNLALSARLRTLKYCTTESQQRTKEPEELDSAQQLFLQVVYAILALNFIGTVYDVATGDDTKKNGLLMAWSVRASWRRLTATYEDGDPRIKDLQPLQGARILGMVLTLYGHACGIQYQYYVTNPNFLEKLASRYDGVLMANGTSLIQLFVLLSAFLTTYIILIYSEKHKLRFTLLPLLIVKRVIRIAPLHLLLVGYLATWPRTQDGPLISSVFEEENATCRRKFWAHAFFLQNVVDKSSICLGPSWYLSVDMHLYILVCTLTLTMLHRRRQAIRLYATLFVISSVMCGVLAYINNWQAMIHYTTPDNLRGVYKNVESFHLFYQSTWAALPACFMGMAMAHAHYELQQMKFNFGECKWFKHLHNHAILVGPIYLTLVGYHLRQYQQPLATAAYVTFDRPMICVIGLLVLFGLINVDGPQRRFFGWRGWTVIARLSLPVMMINGNILEIITARPVAYYVSDLGWTLDFFGAVILCHLCAVPLALLVEIPTQMFISQFIVMKQRSTQETASLLKTPVENVDNK